MKLGVPLELRRDLKPARVASGKSSLHSSCEGPLGTPLQSVQGHTASSRVEARTSGFLSSSDMDLGVPMKFQQESHVSCGNMELHFPFGVSKRCQALSLSSEHKGLGLFLEVPRGCHTSLCILSQSSGFQSSQ